MKVINNFMDFERLYLENNRPFLIEQELLKSFSKEDLKILIETTKEEYLNEKFPYMHQYEKDKIKIDYPSLDELSKYFFDMINYYFAGGEELEISKNFLDKLERSYKSRFEYFSQSNKANTSKRNIDVSSIPIRQVLELYIKTPYNLRRSIHCILKGHNDSNPSLKIYEETNSFYCFGCGRGGNIVNLIAEIEGISSKEAYKKLIELFT